MKLTKLATALLLSGALTLTAATVSAADLNLSVAHSVGEESTQQVTSLAFQKKIAEISNGSIEATIYPNAQMGGDRELVEGVQAGNLAITTSSPAPQANFVPSAAIFDLPFAFATIDEIDKTFKDPEFVKALGAEYEKAGFHLLGISNLGFRITTANKAIITPEDLKGLTIRTMENKNHIEMWRKLGANPTPLAFNELYTALQQSTVDGQENPMELIYTQKYFEQQTDISKTNHIPHCLCWVMNLAQYDALTEEQKKQVDEAADFAIAAGEKYIRDNDAEYEKQLLSRDRKIHNLTPEQLAKFKSLVVDLWPEIEAQVAPEVYKSYTKNIAK